MPQCNTEECIKEAFARNLCKSHYRYFLLDNPGLKRPLERHGMYGSPEYYSWVGMKSRCSNPNSSDYGDYGAKGVSVCESWKKSFIQFYTDMGKKPTPKHTIDRIDTHGNYEPKNCKWSTQAEQQVNKTNNNQHPGVHWNNRMKKWEAKLIHDKMTVLQKYFTRYNDAVAARKAAEIKYLGATL